MILNNTPNHEAILSNVGEIGEFRIRNSAKAFSILSSGLYANKIRAIVRELSCNAVDSHAAAGNTDTPFDVHLPTNLEPWFAVRDYGIGLSHDQVTKIYTTYFESTKTGSNDFIGALGLGSKSPFSYTDNFTVAAVQNGVRGIYSAFINGDGVPSIALMSTESTTESNGVEIKFSVNDQYDYTKFREESRTVYQYFSLQPRFNIDLTIPKKSYATENIIPGVHEYHDNYRTSMAVMGNIAYPINVPNSQTVLGKLSTLLDCGLELHFEIGELDFQASREGLSYIPQTIEAIKRKLSTVNDALTVKLTVELDKIDNLWDRAKEISSASRRRLWAAAVVKYIADTKFPLFRISGPPASGYGSYTEFRLPEDMLRKDYNTVIKSFFVDTGRSGGNTAVTNTRDHRTIKIDASNGTVEYQHGWEIPANSDSTFVINDTKMGATERAKFHFKTAHPHSNGNSGMVYVLEPHDRNKPMLTDKLFAFLQNPPKVMLVSTLAQKERKTLGRDITILQLQRRDRSNRRNSDDLVWRDAGKSGQFDANRTFYYVPLNGFIMTSKYNWLRSASGLGEILKSCSIGELNNITVYGVRKADIEAIESKKNWVNLEDHIVAVLKKFKTEIFDTLLAKSLDRYEFLRYNKQNNEVLEKLTDQNGHYATVLGQVARLKTVRYLDTGALQALLSGYGEDLATDINKGKAKLEADCDKCYQLYPLLEMLEHSVDRSSFDSNRFAAYINMVDSQKNEQI